MSHSKFYQNWTGSNTDPVLPGGTGPEALRGLTLGVDTELDGLGNLEDFLEMLSDSGDGKSILGILQNWGIRKELDQE